MSLFKHTTYLNTLLVQKKSVYFKGTYCLKFSVDDEAVNFTKKICLKNLEKIMYLLILISIKNFTPK